MAQGIVAGELMAGPCKLYTRETPITDSADDLAIIAASTPNFAGFTYQGLTDGGVNASLQKSYANHTVDQSPDWVMSTITERHAEVSTNLAAPTLDKFALANNGGAITTGVGTAGAWDSWEPITDTIEDPEQYISIVLYGRRVDRKGMIVVIRNALSVDNMEFAFTKDNKTTLSVSWAGHFVSDDVAPIVVYSQR